MLTDNGADDVGKIRGLLEQVEGKIASFLADGAYEDGEPVYQAVAGKQHDSPPDVVVIPPSASAVLNADAADLQS